MQAACKHARADRFYASTQNESLTFLPTMRSTQNKSTSSKLYDVDAWAAVTSGHTHWLHAAKSQHIQMDWMVQNTKHLFLIHADNVDTSCVLFFSLTKGEFSPDRAARSAWPLSRWWRTRAARVDSNQESVAKKKEQRDYKYVLWRAGHRVLLLLGCVRCENAWGQREGWVYYRLTNRGGHADLIL
jgi:hypothetical protein